MHQIKIISSPFVDELENKVNSFLEELASEKDKYLFLGVDVKHMEVTPYSISDGQKLTKIHFHNHATILYRRYDNE